MRNKAREGSKVFGLGKTNETTSARCTSNKTTQKQRKQQTLKVDLQKCPDRVPLRSRVG